MLDYLVQKIEENPNLVLKGEAHKISDVINGLALCDYKPKKWESVKRHLQQTTVFNSPSLKKIMWLKTAASFCVLDIYKMDVLERALQQNFVQQVITRGYKSDLNNLLVIYQAIATFKPELQHLLPPRGLIGSILRNAVHIVEKEVNVVGPLLEKGIGGKIYVLNDLESQLGHHIGKIEDIKKET